MPNQTPYPEPFERDRVAERPVTFAAWVAEQDRAARWVGQRDAATVEAVRRLNLMTSLRFPPPN